MTRPTNSTEREIHRHRQERGIKLIQEMLRPSTTYWRMKIIRGDAYATAREILPGDTRTDRTLLIDALDRLGVRHSGRR